MHALYLLHCVYCICLFYFTALRPVCALIEKSQNFEIMATNELERNASEFMIEKLGDANTAWQVPGPLDLYHSLGWSLVAGWVYVILCLVYTWTVVISVLHHILTKYPPIQRIPNAFIALNFALASSLSAAMLFDPRYQAFFDLLRDLCVGSHLAMMGIVLVCTCEGPNALVERVRSLWAANKWPPYYELSDRAKHLQERYWWFFQPEKNPTLYVYLWLMCLLQYPLLLASIQFYTMATIAGPLISDPRHFVWQGTSPGLNAIATMSFWLCAIGRNHLFMQQLPLLDYGDVMRDRERTMFLLLDFIWLQGLGTQMFPSAGLRLPGVNEYTTYGLLLRALIVGQICVAVMRLRRFWLEPLDNRWDLPPIAKRIDARERRLAARISVNSYNGDIDENDSNNEQWRRLHYSEKSDIVRRNVHSVSAR